MEADAPATVVVAAEVVGKAGDVEVGFVLLRILVDCFRRPILFSLRSLTDGCQDLHMLQAAYLVTNMFNKTLIKVSIEPVSHGNVRIHKKL